MSLKNAMEEIVKEKLDKMLKYCDVCTCEHCYKDIMAITLNRVKSAYINTNEGELYKRIDATRVSNDIELEVIILQAIDIVKAHPRH